jgi:uroporphyrin-3 C-methyltransferase
MNESTSQPENHRLETVSQANSSMTEQAEQPDRNLSPDGSAHISITQLTLAVLVVIFLWQWLDGHRAISDMQQQLAKKIAEMDAGNKANQILLAEEQDQTRELFTKMATLESRYAESQNQRAALETLYNDLSGHRDETVLAEVEQMLLIASQQLQTSFNVRAALIAMQNADARLQRINRPAFNGLRQTINRDMVKLRALHDADIAGISLQLNNLIAIVDQMPLVYRQRAANEPEAQSSPPANETSWQKLVREIWQEARQLVKIENTGKAEIPLLPPNQEFFLRENLKLSLLSSRLALLSRDEVSFKQGLKTAQLWTARYFDDKSAEYREMSDGLKKIAASDISIELPDISASLQAVRNYRLTRESGQKTGSDLQPAAPIKDSSEKTKVPATSKKGQPKAAQ